MALKAPRAGEIQVAFPGAFGKQMVKRNFYYLQPDGTEREESFMLYHYTKDWVVLIMGVTKDGKVIALREFRHAANDFLIVLPGGQRKAGQTAKEVAEDEFSEETGFKAGKVHVFEPMLWIDPAVLNIRFAAILLTDCEKVSEPRCESTETMETILVPIEEWYSKIFRHEILDTKTTALSLWALPHLMVGDLKFK